MNTQNGRYGPAFKFRVVLEALRAEGQRTEAEVARAYGIHPVTLSTWKRQFLERRAEVFGGKEEVKAYEKRIADLERVVGHKEVEIALLTNFLKGR
jgi:transposase-like protein